MVSWENIKGQLIKEERPMYFNKNGEKITLEEYILLRINPEYVLIKNEKINENFMVFLNGGKSCNYWEELWL